MSNNKVYAISREWLKKRVHLYFHRLRAIIILAYTVLFIIGKEKSLLWWTATTSISIIFIIISLFINLRILRRLLIKSGNSRLEMEKEGMHYAMGKIDTFIPWQDIKTVKITRYPDQSIRSIQPGTGNFTITLAGWENMEEIAKNIIESVPRATTRIEQKNRVINFDHPAFNFLIYIFLPMTVFLYFSYETIKFFIPGMACVIMGMFFLIKNPVFSRPWSLLKTCKYLAGVMLVISGGGLIGMATHKVHTPLQEKILSVESARTMISGDFSP